MNKEEENKIRLIVVEEIEKYFDNLMRKQQAYSRQQCGTTFKPNGSIRCKKCE